MVDLDQRYRGRLVVFERVPAAVCVQCDEKVLDRDTVDALRNKLQEIWASGVQVARPVRYVSVPVYDFQAPLFRYPPVLEHLQSTADFKEMPRPQEGRSPLPRELIVASRVQG
ncbi:MAG: YgiT-type zinc finger protein [Chloroflexi bacterium]|nr:YgiT-type zinc finger protein [Chloroflexota bacterium]